MNKENHQITDDCIYTMAVNTDSAAWLIHAEIPAEAEFIHVEMSIATAKGIRHEIEDIPYKVTRLYVSDTTEMAAFLMFVTDELWGDGKYLRDYKRKESVFKHRLIKSPVKERVRAIKEGIRSMQVFSFRTGVTVTNQEMVNLVREFLRNDDRFIEEQGTFIHTLYDKRILSDADIMSALNDFCMFDEFFDSLYADDILTFEDAVKNDALEYVLSHLDTEGKLLNNSLSGLLKKLIWCRYPVDNETRYCIDLKVDAKKVMPDEEGELYLLVSLNLKEVMRLVEMIKDQEGNVLVPKGTIVVNFVPETGAGYDMELERPVLLDAEDILRFVPDSRIGKWSVKESFGAGSGAWKEIVFPERKEN